jgi:hypothetical protein
MKEWTYPTVAELKVNAQQMKQLSDQVNAVGNNSNNGGVRGDSDTVASSDSDGE